MGNTNFETGKLGEFICATKLMQMGETCEIVNLDCVDIVVNRGEQGLVRIQVKSSRYKTKDSRSSKGYQFFPVFGLTKTPLTTHQCDAIAFVALDIERVIFQPITEIRQQKTKRFAKAKFHKENLECDTWATTLEGVYQ